MITSKSSFNFLLVVCVLIETLSYTYLHQTSLYYGTSVLYFFSGLGICFLPLLLPLVTTLKVKKGWYVALLFLIPLIYLLLANLPQKFQRFPLDYHIADMLPRIKIYAERFLHGRYVYDNVTEIWGGNLPPYFPATWIPFIPSIIFGFDMRWVTVTLFLLSLFLTLRMAKFDNDIIHGFITILLLGGLFLLLNYNLYFGSEIWVTSYEGLIAFYYVLLCVAIISWNPYFIGVAITLCLLSRFSLSFWIPAFVIFLWRKESFAFSFKTSAATLMLFAGIFILPFVIGHLDAFSKTIEQYKKAPGYFGKSIILMSMLMVKLACLSFLTQHKYYC